MSLEGTRKPHDLPSIQGRILDWNAVYQERELPYAQKTASLFPNNLRADADDERVRVGPIGDNDIIFTAQMKGTKYGNCIEFIAYLKYPQKGGQPTRRHPDMPSFSSLITSSYSFLRQHNPEAKGLYFHFEQDKNNQGKSEFYDDIINKRKKALDESKPVDDKQIILQSRDGKNPLQILHLVDPEKLTIEEGTTVTGAGEINAYYLF